MSDYESDGVPLKAISETPGFDPVRTWGPGPLLIFKASSPEGHAPVFESTPGTSDVETSALRADSELSAYLSPFSILVPVRKSGRNDWGRQITIGRARANDIRLAEPGVSKVHAQIFPPVAWPMLDEGGWRIRDAGSTNGTAILAGSGEVRVPTTGDGYKLSAGMEVRFGTVLAVFVEPEGLRIALEYAKKEWARRDKEASQRGSSDTGQVKREP